MSTFLEQGAVGGHHARSHSSGSAAGGLASSPIGHRAQQRHANSPSPTPHTNAASPTPQHDMQPSHTSAASLLHHHLSGLSDAHYGAPSASPSSASFYGGSAPAEPNVNSPANATGAQVPSSSRLGAYSPIGTPDHLADGRGSPLGNVTAPQSSAGPHHLRVNSGGEHHRRGASFGSPSNNGGNASVGADDGTILFIGDLSRTVKEEELHHLFSPFGTVVAIDIKRDKLTFNNLGYGFVQFSSRAEAQSAKKALNGYELNARKIRIGWAQKNTTLFVGDLDGTITSEELIRVFEIFGPIIVEESFVKEPSRKYGFVRFGSREDAERAKSEMNHKLLGSRPIRIGWGDSNFEKHSVHVQFDPNACHLQTGINVNQIFTEAFFVEAFTPFAQACATSISNISLPKHNHTKKLKGYAFIHYEENENGEQAAVLALQTLTNQFDQPPAASHLQNDGSRGNGASSPFPYVHHLQQSFSPRQGAGHHAPQTSVPNNNSQQHVLGGIPVKYSFGKRQIFSRHRRANDPHHHGHGHHNMHGQHNGGMPGMHHQHHSHHHHGGPHHASNPMAMMMQQQQQQQQQGGNRYSGRGGHRGYSRDRHDGGHYGAGYNNANQYGGDYRAMDQQHGGALHPHQQSLHAPQHQLHAPGQAMNRYHTNSSGPASTHHSHHTSYGGNAVIAPPSSMNGGAGMTPAQAAAHAQAQAQAAAATSWMIQSLASQQYGAGIPLSVQQVTQAYQHIQQQQQQVAAQALAAEKTNGVSVGPLYADVPPVQVQACGDSVEITEAATNLASAANAFFQAQSQLYLNQANAAAAAAAAPISQQASNTSSLAQLMSGMSALGLGGNGNVANGSPAASPVATLPQQQQAHPSIISGHSSTVSTPLGQHNTSFAFHQ